MSKKRISLILGLFFVLLLINQVQAVSPFITQTTTGGCIIVPIMRESLKLNQTFDFNFHVLNSTTGYPLSNTSVSCVFHLYNQTGDHTYSEIIKNDPFSDHFVVNEFVTRLSGSNFSKIGDYAYVVQCNSTATGGGCAEKGLFTVTNSGYIASTGRAIFDIGLLFVLLLFLVGSIILMVQSQNLIAKTGMFGLSYLLLVAISFIGWQMAGDFLLSAPFLVEFLHIMFIILMFALPLVLIGGFGYIIVMIARIKEIQNLIDHGMPENEAHDRVKRRRR